MKKTLLTAFNVAGRYVPLTRRQRKLKNLKPFIVVNTDDDYGVFIKRIIAEAKRWGLEQQSSRNRSKSVKKIKTKELIIFGDSPKRYSYDYRVETDYNSVREFDGRIFKQFDAVDDIRVILKKIRDYAKANFQAADCDIPSSLLDRDYHFRIPKKRKYYRKQHHLSNYYQDVPRQLELELEIEIPKTRAKTSRTVFKKADVGDYLAYTHNIEDLEEKVTVHHNWVKIGYNQYDIDLDLATGEEFITIGKKKFFVAEDHRGNRFLTY